MKNILITGGAGFIGSNLSKYLISKGFSITVLDNFSEQIHGLNPSTSPFYNELSSQVKIIAGSVTSKEDWLAAIINQDAIIHLAAETGTGQSMYEIEKYVGVNITGTALLWDILTNQPHSIKKVVVASSRAIYGEGKYICSEHGVVFPLARENGNMKAGDFNIKCPVCNVNVELTTTTEDSKKHPTSIYGFTKQAQEEMSLLAGKALQIPVSVLRYQNVYGPGQALSNPYTGILSIFSTRIKNENDLLIFEDGEESRDFVYIEDVVVATYLALVKEESNFEAFNVGTGIKTDVLTIAQMLVKLYYSNVDIKISGNFRLGDIRHNYADISKIKRMLGFEPVWKFENGVTEFVKWVNNQDILEDKYESSIIEMKSKGLFN